MARSFQLNFSLDFLYITLPSHPAVKASPPPPPAPSLRSCLKGLQQWKLTPQRNVEAISTRDSLKIRQPPTESCREFIDSNCFLPGPIEELLRLSSNKLPRAGVWPVGTLQGLSEDGCNL